MVQMATRVTSPVPCGGQSPGRLRDLRAAVSGLVWLSGGEEAGMLLTADTGESGTPGCWSATATIAHNSEFREQQVARLVAVRERRSPPDFPPIVHTDPDEYERFAAMTPAEAAWGSRSTTMRLIDELGSAAEEDLLDPGRNAWLRGRPLWLQIVVRVRRWGWPTTASRAHRRYVAVTSRRSPRWLTPSRSTTTCGSRRDVSRTCRDCAARGDSALCSANAGACAAPRARGSDRSTARR